VGFFNPRVPFQSAHPFGARDSGCDFAVRPDVLAEILARHDPAAADRPELPFGFGSGPCDPRTFLLQRVLVRRIALGEPIDDLEVEESSLHLADRVARAATGDSAAKPVPRATGREREEAEELRGILSSHPGQRHALDTLSRRLDSTPFRLCRSFRTVTGTTIHRHLTDLRLQQALGRLAEGSRDLTGLALELGFSSHSHFTSVFRKRLGTTPDAVRREMNRPRLASLRGRLDSVSAAGG
jgi:AraC-like DNA-binding protein